MISSAVHPPTVGRIEAQLTVPTSVRFLPRVSHGVLLQLPTTNECLVAGVERTLERPFHGVNRSVVLYQCPIGFVVLFAALVRTLVRSLIRMLPPVGSQIASGVATLITKLALEAKVFRMNIANVAVGFILRFERSPTVLASDDRVTMVFPRVTFQ